MIQTYRKIFDLLDRRERRRFALLMVMILVMGLLDVAGVASLLPFLAVLSDPAIIQENTLLSTLYQTFGFESDRSFLTFLGAIVFMLVVFSLAFKTLTLYALTRFSTMRNYSISSRLLSAYLDQPYVWFLNRHTADLGKSILSEVSQVVSGSMIPAMNMLAHGTVLIALIALLLFVEPVMMTIAIGVLGGSYVLIFLGVRRLLGRLGERRVRANRERFQVANEAMGGIKDVKLMGLESAYVSRFRPPAEDFARTQAASTIIGEIPRYLLEAVAFGGMLVLVLALLAQENSRIENLVPILGLFAFAGARMFPAMQKIYGSFASLRFGGHALDALHRDIMETRATASNSPVGEPLPLKRELELCNVEYTYPQAQRKALSGLSLKIAANSTVGLVGGTGAGKTTAVDVILGLLTPQKGALRVDGQDITAQNIRAWHRSVGYVPQHIFLTDDTVSSNIAFGVPPGKIDQTAVERAARIAELHEFVMEELPQGYDTMVGERGVRLSGGQRQRIGIARALYHDPDVLVLDEATSALDNLTERAVMDAVHNLTGAKTVIMVAHRLSTVESCHEIILLEQGKVAARGPYHDLLNTSEQFRRMAVAPA